MKLLGNIIGSKKIQVILLVLVTVLIFANTLQNSFAWDDYDFLYMWPSIKDNGNLSVTFSLPSLLMGDLPPNHLGVYRPLRSVFYILSFKLYGTNPFGYHLQAIIIHLAAVLLVYLITGLISKKKFMPFLTAILFATHPIHVESVSFVTASFDTIGVVFLFLSFYLYLRTHYFASFIYAAFAFFTYEMTLVLPLLIVLYDFCFKKRHKLKIFLPYFALLLAYGVTRFLLLKVGDRATYLGPNFLNSAMLSRIEMPEIILQYFSWLIFPINLEIVHNTPANLLSGLLAINNFSKQGAFIANSIMKISVIVPIATIAAGILLIIKAFSKKKAIVFGLSWIIISLFTVSNILPQGTTWAERFLYLPSFGFAFLTAYLYSHLKRVSSYLLIALFLANIVFYSTVTFLRNRDWQNDKTLFSSILRKHPNDHLALNGLGLSYLRENSIDLAIESFKKASELSPANADYWNNLALAYGIKGNFDLAISIYKESIKIAPKYDQTHINLANLYLANNQDDLAIKEYRIALEINPNNNRLRYLLGKYYEKHKKIED